VEWSRKLTIAGSSMTSYATPPSNGAETHGFALVVLAYRCAMAETCGAHPKYLASVWEVFEAAAPRGEAEALFGFFFRFVRSLMACAERPIGWRQTFCAHLCRDEWLAVDMIVAAQRGDVVGLLGAAAELIGVEGLGDALNATQALASALAQREVYLCPRRDCADCPNQVRQTPTLH
jgi:hypothetical protein